MIGDGPSRCSLTNTVAREHLRVEFAGWVQPWQRLARPGDCLLMTSDVEGFGNVLVEAAAAGLTCVAPSSALGVADAIISGITGVLARSTRPIDLADAVAEATALPIGSPAVTRWLGNFDPVVAAGRLDIILRSVVADATLTRCTSSPRSDRSPASKVECPRS
jgi:glycosyltransferase involved in cell wall biosynthesis